MMRIIALSLMLIAWASVNLAQAQSSLLLKDVDLGNAQFEKAPEKTQPVNYLFNTDDASLSYGAKGTAPTSQMGSDDFESVFKAHITPTIEATQRVETVSSMNAQENSQDDALKSLQLKAETGVSWKTFDFMKMNVSRSESGSFMDHEADKQADWGVNSEINLSKWTKITPSAKWDTLHSNVTGIQRTEGCGLLIHQQLGNLPLSLNSTPNLNYKHAELDDLYTREVGWNQDLKWSLDKQTDVSLGANVSKEQSLDSSWWEHTKGVFGTWTKKIEGLGQYHVNVDHTTKVSSTENQEWVGMKAGPEMKMNDDWKMGLDVGHQFRMKSAVQPQENSLSLSIKGTF